MKVRRVKRFLTVWAVLAVPVALSAQAFSLNEIGSCAVGRAFAVTASPCGDATAIFWNSAALTQLKGWNVVAGVATISVNGSFTQDTTRRKFNADVPTEVVPHFFANYHGANSKLAIGLGVYVPYGLTTQWRDDFPGRFVAKKATLASIYVQPNLAWQLNSKWSVGGGPIWGSSTVELIQALDLSEQPTAPGGPHFSQLGIARLTEFARARLKGSASALGAQIAVAGRPTPRWNVGIRFLTPMDFSFDDADARFTQVATGLVVGGQLTPPFNVGALIDTISAIRSQFTTGALRPQTVSTHIAHPAQVQAGFSYTGYKNWLVEADLAWTGWKRFKELPVDFSVAPSRTLIEDYNNTTAFRLGAEYTIPRNGWKLRAGFSGVASAAPAETVTPLLPEQDRAYWTFGAASAPIRKTWVIEGAYAHVSTRGARGRIVERTAAQTAAAVNSGVFDLSANVFSFTLKASF